MLRSHTKRGWHDQMASLRRRAIAGDVSAMTDLGLNLLEGIQDRNDRSIVRRNPGVAVNWLREAARCGDATAAGSLGYAYDVGLGVRRNCDHAIHWYRKAARSGISGAASNLATVYRDAGNARLAFKWWKRSADMRDGDAAVDVGYCYQYGIGTRKNAAKAKRRFRRAIASKDITQVGREAAMYHLALQYVDEGKLRYALPLLKRATVDGDFPEAAAALDQINEKSDFVPCRCKRFVDKNLRGHTRCLLHTR